jgi:hypothetical protein
MADLKLNEYLIVDNNVVPLKEDESSSSFNGNVETDSGLEKMKQLNQQADPEGNTTVDEADIVIDNTGRKIRMDVVKAIVSDAIYQLLNMVDPGLIMYFNNINIIYTWRVRTFGTTSSNLYINPSFLLYAFDKGDVVYIAYILLHEAYHVLLGHCDDPKSVELFKKGPRERKLANIAEDFQVNWLIENSTFDMEEDGKLVYPFEGATKDIGGYIDPTYAYLDWPAIYEILDKLNSIEEPPEEPVEPPTIEPQEQSEEWYKGFLEGIRKKIEELRKNRLIESSLKIYSNSLNENI